MLQDWMKGRRSEVREINGLVVDLQRRLGGLAPANAATVELAVRIEDGSLEAGPGNLGAARWRRCRSADRVASASALSKTSGWERNSIRVRRMCSSSMRSASSASPSRSAWISSRCSALMTQVARLARQVGERSAVVLRGVPQPADDGRQLARRRCAGTSPSAAAVQHQELLDVGRWPRCAPAGRRARPGRRRSRPRHALAQQQRLEPLPDLVAALAVALVEPGDPGALVGLQRHQAAPTARMRSASRTGSRLALSSSARSSCRIRAPGLSAPDRICVAHVVGDALARDRGRRRRAIDVAHLGLAGPPARACRRPCRAG